MTAILDRHIRRLEAMTMDLLDLHVVESGKNVRRRRTDIVLGRWWNGLTKPFRRQGLRKGVTLDVAAPDPAFS